MRRVSELGGALYPLVPSDLPLLYILIWRNTIPLTEKLHAGFGAGVEIAVTSFHQYNYRWMFSVRFPF
jgi:hypothetical protein